MKELELNSPFDLKDLGNILDFFDREARKFGIDDSDDEEDDAPHLTKMVKIVNKELAQYHLYLFRLHGHYCVINADYQEEEE